MGPPIYNEIVEYDDGTPATQVTHQTCQVQQKNLRTLSFHLDIDSSIIKSRCQYVHFKHVNLKIFLNRFYLDKLNS